VAEDKNNKPSTPDQTSFQHPQDGVDDTLIAWMLSLTPAERLDVLQSQVIAILEAREANGIR